MTKYLDPSGLGVISFEDFHRGIRAIKNGGEFPAVLGVSEDGNRPNLTPTVELRSCLGKTIWVWFSESCCSVQGGEARNV